MRLYRLSIECPAVIETGLEALEAYTPIGHWRLARVIHERPPAAGARQEGSRLVARVKGDLTVAPASGDADGDTGAGADAPRGHLKSNPNESYPSDARTPAAQPLTYRERGLLTLLDSATRLPFERTLRLIHHHDGRLEHCFTDGRPFFTVPWRPGVHPLHHDCPPDAYTGALTIVGPALWGITWHVDGPRKRQTISSRLRRIG
ncbi:MAG: DUF6314 family protein [Pseudomonadota bacterium]